MPAHQDAAPDLDLDPSTMSRNFNVFYDLESRKKIIQLNFQQFWRNQQLRAIGHTHLHTDIATTRLK